MKKEGWKLTLGVRDGCVKKNEMDEMDSSGEKNIFYVNN